MEPIELLRKNVTNGSASYGYTLCIWGSGALLLNLFELSYFKIFSYIGGALVGFFLLALMAFRNIFAQVEPREDTLIVASMVHFIGAMGTVYLTHIIIRFLSGSLSQVGLFFLVGVNATFTFNLLLLVEEYFYEALLYIESRLAKIF